MDMPCVRWQKHVKEKWTRLDPKEKKYFSCLSDIDMVFELALSQTNQNDLDFLSGVSKDYPVQKDTELAARCREKGNASFKTRNYSDSVLHYSQGVCFASQNSEQLALCYANRSAALLHLQHHKECLEDIDRALKHGYPTRLLHKLHERRSLCLNHLQSKAGSGDQDGEEQVDARETEEDPNQTPRGPHSLRGTEPESPLHPGVSVCFSPVKGRHLVATEGRPAGVVILEDRAYSCVLIPGMERLKGAEGGCERRGVFGTEDRHCHRCLGETVDPVPCEECSYARYCSYWCRREAWEEYHRWECPIGAELRALGVMSQLALRLALKAGLKDVQRAMEPIKGQNNGSKLITEKDQPGSSVGDPFTCYYGDSYLSVYHLLPHLSSHTPSLRYLCAVTIATLYLTLSRAVPPPASWNGIGSSASRKCPNQSQGQGDEEEPLGWVPELSLLGSVVLRHMLQLRCNAQAVSALRNTGERNAAVQSSNEVRIGTAVFPTLSVLNHSCSPNTSLSFSPGTSLSLSPGPRASPGSPGGGSSAGLATADCGTTVTVRAARDICPGQEVLHCYGPHCSRMRVSERQRLLQEQYYFQCDCEACRVEQGEGVMGEGVMGERSTLGSDTGFLCGKCKEPLKRFSEVGGGWCVCPCGQRVSGAELDLKLQEVKVHLEQAVELMEGDRPEEALGVLQRAESRSGLFLRDTHPLQGELADTMARAYATMGDWQRAASQLERSVAAVGSQYGEESIELGRQLFKLAQLHFNSGSPGPALEVIPRANRLLSLHSGKHCPELQELQAMENCLQDVF